jgi:hypothetical protein
VPPYATRGITSSRDRATRFRSAPASQAANIHETSPTGGPDLKDLNTSEQMIANLDEVADHTAVHNIKISAREDGSFVVTNPRNGYIKEYKPRR